ncbi:MAG: hypothetical protein ACHQAU_07240 [Gammaproteobacteria bacterium]
MSEDNTGQHRDEGRFRAKAEGAAHAPAVRRVSLMPITLLIAAP